MVLSVTSGNHDQRFKRADRENTSVTFPKKNSFRLFSREGQDPGALGSISNRQWFL